MIWPQCVLLSLGAMLQIKLQWLDDHWDSACILQTCTESRCFCSSGLCPPHGMWGEINLFLLKQKKMQLLFGGPFSYYEYFTTFAGTDSILWQKSCTSRRNVLQPHKSVPSLLHCEANSSCQTWKCSHWRGDGCKNLFPGMSEASPTPQGPPKTVGAIDSHKFKEQEFIIYVSAICVHDTKLNLGYNPE